MGAPTKRLKAELSSFTTGLLSPLFSSVGPSVHSADALTAYMFVNGGSMVLHRYRRFEPAEAFCNVDHTAMPTFRQGACCCWCCGAQQVTRMQVAMHLYPSFFHTYAEALTCISSASPKWHAQNLSPVPALCMTAPRSGHCSQMPQLTASEPRMRHTRA